MDFFNDPCNVISFTSFLLTLILDMNESFVVIAPAECEDATETDAEMTLDFLEASVMDTLSLLSTTLHNYRLCFVAYPIIDEISTWVKSRSTIWFSHFLLEEYNNSRWISMFRMTKGSVFALAEILKLDI